MGREGRSEEGQKLRDILSMVYERAIEERDVDFAQLSEFRDICCFSCDHRNQEVPDGLKSFKRVEIDCALCPIVVAEFHVLLHFAPQSSKMLEQL